MTAEEYPAAERAAEFRSEHYDGCVYAMAGASFPHGIITTNLGRALSQALRKRCFVLSSDARLRVSPGRVFTYPNIMVLCGAPRFACLCREPPMASRVLENRTFHPHDSTKTANSFLPQAESISESMPQGVTEFRCSFRCS